jgi:ribonucleoside-triphosphate reductase
MFIFACSRLFSFGYRKQHRWLPYGHFIQQRLLSSFPKVLPCGENIESDFSSPSTLTRFSLRKEFLEPYKTRSPPFGFNGLGEFVYRRTYSRVKNNSSDGANEVWWETCARVVEGTMNLILRWLKSQRLPLRNLHPLAEGLYERMWSMKWLPPGRGLWAMGSPLTEEDPPLYAALNNCGFVTTKDIRDDPSTPFVFLMDMSMLGVGVGFDTRGAGTLIVPGPDYTQPEHVLVIEDSRDGWVTSLRMLLDSYFLHRAPVRFDYSHIRPAGTPIKRMGGTASGPAPLKRLHDSVRSLLNRCIGQPLTVTCIVDIMNLIGRCVVSGNVRQTAEIAFGEPIDEYLDLKNYQINPHRAEYGWTSNNSVYARIGMDYGPIVKRIRQNGEPGLAWLENMQAYGRMTDTERMWADRRALGGNPCLEQTLEPFELCCLVETFPAKHDSLEDYLETLKYAFLYAKVVTLGPTHWPQTNAVMLRNRRIGCSMSGIAQFLAQRGIDALREWCERGYAATANLDREYSQWFAIPLSIKRTSVKPSGTVSLLAGATPGMHFPISRFYLRRVRLPRRSELVAPLRAAGHHIEPSRDDPENTVVVAFPVDVGAGVRSLASVSMWEQLALAAFLQRYWADNQVSATITFSPSEADQLEHALNIYQYLLKGVSFLPQGKDVYAQMPYEEITESQYVSLTRSLKPLDLSSVRAQPVPDKFCDNDQCRTPSILSSTVQE